MLAVGACFSSGSEPASRSTPTVPLSKDPPLESGEIHTPSEPMERPRGPLAFVVDQTSFTVYQYDVGRGRFLGPGVRLRGVKAPSTPGYPTFVSNDFPQGAAATESHLVIAGGGDGTVVTFPIGAAGLGPRVEISPPVIPLREPCAAADGEEVTTNESVSFNSDEAKRPSHPSHDVVAISDHAVVAFANEPQCYSVGYLVDLSTRTVKASVQLDGNKGLRSVTPYKEGFLASDTYGRQLLQFNADLSLERAFPVEGTGTPGPLAVTGDTAIVGIANRQPAQLLALNLTNGSSRVLSEFEDPKPPVFGPSSGPVAASGTDIWWALSTEGPDTLRHLSARRESDWTDRTAKLQTDDRVLGKDNSFADRSGCDGVRALLKLGQRLLGTCAIRGELANVPLAGGPVVVQDAGDFPNAVVAASPSHR